VVGPSHDDTPRPELPKLPALPELPEVPELPEIPELTEDVIAEAMARAEKVACRPGDDRCYPLPYGLNEARASCTPKGRCRVGWITPRHEVVDTRG
jgi:hypothetical protein